MRKNDLQFRPTFDLICFDIQEKIIRQQKGFYSKDECLQEWQHILDCQLKGMRWAKQIVRYEIVDGKPAAIPNGKKPFGIKI